MKISKNQIYWIIAKLEHQDNYLIGSEPRKIDVEIPYNNPKKMFLKIKDKELLQNILDYGVDGKIFSEEIIKEMFLF